MQELRRHPDCFDFVNMYSIVRMIKFKSHLKTSHLDQRRAPRRNIKIAAADFVSATAKIPEIVRYLLS